MASVTIEEILNRAQEFELEVEEFYAKLRDTTADNGVKLLTYYLSRHRRHIERALAAVGTEELRRVKAVRLKTDIPFSPPARLTDAPTEKVDGSALLSAAIEYDGQLIAYYKRIGEQEVGEEATRLIESLVRLEEKDIVMLKKMAAMNYF